jgi:hypothetical protein
VESVTLAVGDGHGNFEDLKTETSSGYPPYNAVFSLQLTSAQKERIVSALSGQKGMLAIRYHASLSEPVKADTTIEGDVKSYLARVEADATQEDLLDYIERAVTEGSLSLKQTGTASEGLTRKSLLLAKEQAAATLQRLAGGGPEQSSDRDEQNTSTLKASASLSENATSPLESSADVSSWFPEGNGKKYVQFLSVSLPEPS